ncbi:pyrroline-5-carboxylate reductase [Luteimonas sp. Y-2-2-4F]|nr:pyrroline-5-carboxylate reductase [Luteimonas sp. Y-2-2-4F]MCD9030764.1 pyrroline-5-carboxylate reductase [Luteimonas sp. Y-2-2-4F]
MSVPNPESRSPNPEHVAFVGGGNMARSLIGGLVGGGRPAAAIRVAEPGEDKRRALAADFGVQVFADAASAADGASVWVLSVKPQAMREVCTGLAALARAQRPLVVSIAAGITLAQLARWLGDGVATVRAMPNTPALLGAGMTGLCANAHVDAAARARAEAVMAAAGRTAWIDDEALMDAVTAVSGSGPAYAFLLAEALEDAARGQGLPADTARLLVQQTLLGAARMLAESGEAPATLRQQVTSPGGTTQAALEAFEAGGLRRLVAEAVAAAQRRGGELSAAHD